MRGKKGVPHADPDDPPRRGANQAKGHGTWETDRPPVPGVVGRESGRVWFRVGHRSTAAELVQRYEPAVRRSVRLRLDPRLRRVCDSMDICQAVLGSFFVRAASGQYELDTPEQLLRLLTAMARNKLLNQARQDRVSLPGHEGGAIPTAFAQDGRTLVTAGAVSGRGSGRRESKKSTIRPLSTGRYRGGVIPAREGPGCPSSRSTGAASG